MKAQGPGPGRLPGSPAALPLLLRHQASRLSGLSHFTCEVGQLWSV